MSTNFDTMFKLAGDSAGDKVKVIPTQDNTLSEQAVARREGLKTSMRVFDDRHDLDYGIALRVHNLVLLGVKPDSIMDTLGIDKKSMVGLLGDKGFRQAVKNSIAIKREEEASIDDLYDGIELEGLEVLKDRLPVMETAEIIRTVQLANSAGRKSYGSGGKASSGNGRSLDGSNGEVGELLLEADREVLVNLDLDASSLDIGKTVINSKGQVIKIGNKPMDTASLTQVEELADAMVELSIGLESDGTKDKEGK